MILSIIAVLIIMKSVWPDIDFTSGSFLAGKRKSGYELRAGEVQDAQVAWPLGWLWGGCTQLDHLLHTI